MPGRSAEGGETLPGWAHEPTADERAAAEVQTARKAERAAAKEAQQEALNASADASLPVGLPLGVVSGREHDCPVEHATVVEYSEATSAAKSLEGGVVQPRIGQKKGRITMAAVPKVYSPEMENKVKVVVVGAGACGKRSWRVKQNTDQSPGVQGMHTLHSHARIIVACRSCYTAEYHRTVTPCKVQPTE